MADYNLGTARGKIDIDASGAKRGSRQAKDAVDDFNKSLGENEKAADRSSKKSSELRDNLIKVAGGAGLVAAAVQTLKFPVMIQGITAAVGVVGALTAAAVSLTSALGPLAGLLPAAAVGALAFGQAAGVFKLATSNIEDGFKAASKAAEEFGVGSREVQEALKDYSPPARQLILHLIDLKKPFEDLRDATQAAMFPGFISAIHTLEPLIGRFRGALVSTAGVIGDLARRGTELVASPAISGQLNRLLNANVGTINGLGNAILRLIAPITTLLVAAQPVVDMFVRLANNATSAFAAFIRGAESSGALANFFRETQEVVSTLLSIFGSLATILGNVGRAAYDTGRQLWESIEGTLERVASLTGSLEGQNRLKDFFESAKPTIDAVGRLVGDIAVGLARLFEMLGPDIAPVIDQIRTQFLPALLQLFGKIDGPFLASLVNLATAATNFANTFLTATPTLTAIVNALAGLANTAVTVINALGPVGTVLLGILTVIQSAGLLGGIASLVSGFSRLFGFGKGLATIFGLIRTAAAILIPIIAGISAPVLAVVAAIVALIGIGVAIVKNWDTIKVAASVLWGIIKDAFGKGVDFVRGLIARFIGFFVELKDKLAGLVADIVAFFFRMKDGVGDAIGRVITFFKELPGKTFNAIGDLAGRLFNFGREIITKIVEGQLQVAGRLFNFFGELPGKILGAIGNIGGMLFRVGKDIVQGLIDGVLSVFNRVRDTFGRLTNLIPDWKGPMQKDRRLLIPQGEAILDGLIRGLDNHLPELRRHLAMVTNEFSGGSFGLTPEMAVAVGSVRRADAVTSTTTTYDNSRSYNGDTTVIANTDADPHEISRALAWSHRIIGLD